MAAPNQGAGLIIQNGDIFEDQFGPKYDGLRQLWNNPPPDLWTLHWAPLSVPTGSGGQPGPSTRARDHGLG